MIISIRHPLAPRLALFLTIYRFLHPAASKNQYGVFACCLWRAACLRVPPPKLPEASHETSVHDIRAGYQRDSR